MDAAPPAVDRPPLRLGFTGFWDTFDRRDNFFTRLLSRRYAVEVCPQPDFLVHSVLGPDRHDHERHDCVRIFYTGENVPPDWQTTDWAFSFEHSTHPRHFRLPLWPLYVDPLRLVKPPQHDPTAILARKRKFCAFLVSNPLCRTRNEFFRRLSRYKPVDSGGRVLNTLGYRVTDKWGFLADYKFTIAFENDSWPGYTTEKIADPMLVDSLPIYWGDPLVGRDFDTRSFLSAHDSAALDDLVDRVIAVDRDPDLHLQLLSRPWYHGNRVPRCAAADAILAQFVRIIETPIDRVSRRRGLVRGLGLHRAPAAAASLRRRVVRKWKKLTNETGVSALPGPDEPAALHPAP
jgi:hypothetical protein